MVLSLDFRVECMKWKKLLSFEEKKSSCFFYPRLQQLFIFDLVDFLFAFIIGIISINM